MHGLVVLDEHDQVIRPAILWNDGRTAREVDYLNQTVGKDKLSAWTANIAFAGFTAPKVLWMREHEPENFARIKKVMLPKDYINYILTGVHCTDYSDASGMLLLDVEHKRWSKEMLDLCGLTEDQMPKLFESYEAVGTLKPDVAAQLGLSPEVKVCAGAGDNAAAAVGTGTVGDGACNISLGTSGTIFISSEKFGVDPNNALHAFAHADGHYHLMGCMLSAASCNKWLMEDVFQTKDYGAEQAPITPDKLGNNHVFFLPYLMGERSPINDTNARGTFVGMTMDTTRSDLTQAMLEGVAFAIRDSLEVARSLGPGHPAQQAVRRRSQEPPVADDPGQCAGTGAGATRLRAGAGHGRRHAGHGGLRGLLQRGGGLFQAGSGGPDCDPRSRAHRPVRGAVPAVQTDLPRFEGDLPRAAVRGNFLGKLG